MGATMNGFLDRRLAVVATAGLLCLLGGVWLALPDAGHAQALTAESAVSVGQWARLDGGPRQFQRRFDDVHFVNPDTGWVVSISGDVYRTNSGGAIWTKQVNGSIPGVGHRRFRAVGFANAERGYIGTLTFGSSLFETLDGGATWTDITDRITGPEPMGICGISVVDEDHIFAVGRFSGPAVFVRTTDGGQTWQSFDLSALAGTLVDVHFFNENEGIAVGGTSANLGSDSRAVILVTSDGGDTWEQKLVSDGPNSEWGWKITFPSRFTGYVSVEYFDASGTPAKVYRTANGGNKWQKFEIPESQERLGLQGIGFVSDSVGWAGGRGTTSQTVAAGDDWDVFGTIDGNVNRFRFLGDSIGYAVGEYVYKYRSVSDTSVESAVPPALVEIEAVYPQPSSGVVNVRFRRSENVPTTVEVFDALGERVAIVGTASPARGTYEMTWDGRTSSGRRVAAGVYFVRVSSGKTLAESAVVVTS